MINVKTRHFHSSINNQEHLFHWTLYHYLLSSYEYCKVFKNSFFIEHLRSSRLQMVFKIVVLKSFPNFTRKHLYWSLFLKKTLLKKSLQHSCFPVKFANFLRTVFYRTPPVTASALPVAASVLKVHSKVWDNFWQLKAL